MILVSTPLDREQEGRGNGYSFLSFPRTFILLRHPLHQMPSSRDISRLIEKAGDFDKVRTTTSVGKYDFKTNESGTKITKSSSAGLSNSPSSPSHSLTLPPQPPRMNATWPSPTSAISSPPPKSPPPPSIPPSNAASAPPSSNA